MENEHWKNKAVAITAHDIFDLAKSLNEISLENFVIASQVFKSEGGYDCLVHIKVPPIAKNSKELLDLIKERKNETIIFDERTEIKDNQVLERAIKNDFIKSFEKPTDKQLRFLKDHRFKVEPNLTKAQATIKIKEYLNNLNKERPKKQYDY